MKLVEFVFLSMKEKCIQYFVVVMMMIVLLLSRSDSFVLKPSTTRTTRLETLETQTNSEIPRTEMVYQKEQLEPVSNTTIPVYFH